MASTQEHSPMATTSLGYGEKKVLLAGYPALIKFVPGDGDKSKPLVAFIPGLAHNARISYGGHDGSQSEDFLAHWFHKHGFGFLGISYPLDTNPEIMPRTGSDLSLRDWGVQAATAMKNVVEEHGLSSKVVILAWSMAGRTLEPVATEAAALGLTVSLYISLSATPALWGLRKNISPSRITFSPAGYWNCSFLYDLFLPQLLEQNRINDGRIIIDEALYKREYFGSTPVALGGWGFRYNREEKMLAENKWALLEEGRVDNYGKLPAMAAIYPNSPLDWGHSISDKINWSYLIIHKFIADVEKLNRTRKPRVDGFEEKHGQELRILESLRALIYKIPDQMITGIEGNHFFFVGAKGARQTAEIIIGFIEEAEKICVAFQSVLESDQ
ncbi:hypothetical protein N7471_003084 [Penicillium samsonianum]|uniref:uncharacterized protein n=1 Tax=Penicillium samsonianum TaxID=1882272 RepID=UPI00254843CB|nr:uncharacterized protein N7471_003084 [Penicillium samsonianum]KAJ6143631.1 hypothetical protein N7471_003084 [Penicillium samsonianum]